MSTTSATRAARTRTVEGVPPVPPPPPARHRTSGTVAASQAAALSLAVVVLPAVVAFLASSTQSTSDVGWGRAVTVGAGLWLLGHGVPLAATGTTITFVPLGLTALALFCCFACARRSAHTSWRAWGAGAVTYALLTAGVAFLTGATPSWGLVAAALGGLVVGGVGLGAGLLARPDAPTVAALASRTDRWLPPAFRLGLRGGAVAVGLLVVACALLTGAWIVAGRATSGDVVTGLAPGVIGGVVLAVAQLAVLPDLMAWAGAWIVGPGFTVGTGSSFTTAGSQSGALPAVPLLGALPGDDWANALTPWAPALVVVLGVVAGAFVWRRASDVARGRAQVPWSALALAWLGVVLATGVLVGLAVWAASGAVGPGRLAYVGADALLVGLFAAAEVGGGALLALGAGRFAVLGLPARWRDRRVRTDDQDVSAAG
ncbi:DUF6350 family protein [Cellulosimicrobium arenosum]|uniref:Uncharacterized protein n=1 Tax=Cellulosimicrobium arenosum TaxID=2708133 RepID=A0A927IZ54_9MICO|nr:DUF6350 family protein [Cellulosimicrobium arenosum]MBD8078280.1 hypothetical protein [Cellulosimicrobium arenosum]